jgi:arginine repressor
VKREEIEARLRKYLDRDKKGIRKELLKLLLDGKRYTTTELYERLKEKGFDLNIRGVSAMVGLMSARLGILKMELGEKNRYYLKPEYIDLVKSVLEEFDRAC